MDDDIRNLRAKIDDINKRVSILENQLSLKTGDEEESKMDEVGDLLNGVPEGQPRVLSLRGLFDLLRNASEIFSR